MGRMWRRLMAGSVALVLVLGCAGQALGDEGMSSEEKSFGALGWGGVLYTDVILPATFVLFARTGGAPLNDDGDIDGPLDVLGGPLITSGGIAVAFGTGYLMGYVLEVPGDVPFVLHNALWGGVGGMLLGCGFSSDLEACTSSPGVLTIAATGALIAGVYGAVRLDEFREDADLAAVYAFAPPGAIMGGSLLGLLIFGIQAVSSGEPFNTNGFIITLGMAEALSYAISVPILEHYLPTPEASLLSDGQHHGMALTWTW